MSGSRASFFFCVGGLLFFFPLFSVAEPLCRRPVRALAFGNGLEALEGRTMQSGMTAAPTHPPVVEVRVHGPENQLTRVGRKLDQTIGQIHSDVQAIMGDNTAYQRAQTVAVGYGERPPAPVRHAIAHDRRRLDHALEAYAKEEGHAGRLNQKELRLEAKVAAQQDPKLDPVIAGYRRLLNEYRHYYGFDQVPGQGQGQTIAIIGFGNTPTLSADMKYFNTAMGLPDSSFAVHYVAQGPGGVGYQEVNQANFYLPDTDTDAHLAAEWAHAMAPKANIVVVQAADNSFEGAYAAIQAAVEKYGATQVSMSWGSAEWAGETQYDAYFKSHPNVTFLASTGDWGNGTTYPATSPYVVAVGGTSLTLNGDTTGFHSVVGTETAWFRTGGGVSPYEAKPGFQNGWPGDPLYRSVPDVSFNAWAAGFPTYNSNTSDTDFNTATAARPGWLAEGGTSAATPQVAAMIAVLGSSVGETLGGMPGLLYDMQPLTVDANGVRTIRGFNPITTGSNFAPTPNPYRTPDPETVTSSDTAARANAGPGYNLVTGLGTPQGPVLLQMLRSRLIPSRAIAAPAQPRVPQSVARR